MGSPVSYLSRRNCFADIDGKAFVTQKQIQAKLPVSLTNLSVLYEMPGLPGSNVGTVEALV